MNVRNSGYQMVNNYKGFGGKSFNSLHHAAMFRQSAPYHFGLMHSKLYSATHRYSNRIFHNLLFNKGAHEMIPDDVFKWTLNGDSDVDFRIMEFLESGNTTPGKGGQTFRIALDKPWVSEPSLLMWEDNRYPLGYVIGAPQKVGEYYYYTIRLQTGDANAYLDPSLIQVGKTVSDVSTAVTGEMNQKASGDYYDSRMELQSQIGIFSRELKVTDKFIRKEINERKATGTTTVPKEKRLGEGTTFAIKDTNGNVIPNGGFITMAEQRLIEKVDEDAEAAMHYGETSTMNDLDTGYIVRTSAGFRRIVLDGHIKYHNGSLSINALQDFLRSIFLHRNNFSDRRITLATGEGGVDLFHTMIASVASSYLTVDTNFIKSDSSQFSDNSLQFGGQYTRYIGRNGVTIDLEYNPMLDNRKYCKVQHPTRTNYTLDSFRMDIYDLGGNANEYDTNMKTISEANVDSYTYTSPMLDLNTGVYNNGAKVSSHEKGARFWREKSMALWICDASRVGSVIEDPEY